MLEVPEKAFERPPETLQGTARELIRGAYKLEDRLLLILDTERTVNLTASGRVERGVVAVRDSDVASSTSDRLIGAVMPTSSHPLPATPGSYGASAMNNASETSIGPAPSTNGHLDSLDFLRASLASVQANIFLADTDVHDHLRQRPGPGNPARHRGRDPQGLRRRRGRHRRRDHPPLPQGQAARGAHPAQPGRPAAPGRVQLRQRHAAGQDQRRLQPEQRGPGLHRQLGGRQPAPDASRPSSRGSRRCWRTRRRT